MAFIDQNENSSVEDVFNWLISNGFVEYSHTFHGKCIHLYFLHVICTDNSNLKHTTTTRRKKFLDFLFLFIKLFILVANKIDGR